MLNNQYCHSTISELSNLGRKSVRIKQQYQYLQKCRAQSCIPDGVSSQTKFVCSVDDPQLQWLCQSIMDFAASRILDSFIEYYGSWSDNLRHKYYQRIDQIRQFVEKDELDGWLFVVKTKIQQESSKTSKSHLSKLERDKQKNEIYKPFQKPANWNPEGKTKQTRQRRKRQKRPRKRKPRLNKVRAKRKSIKGETPTQELVPKETQQRCVINLSMANITDDHVFLFYLGHSFSPTPGLPEPNQLPQDISNWINKLRAVYCYSNLDMKNSNRDPSVVELERTIVKNNSNRVFKETYNHALELFITKVKSEALGATPKRKHCSPDNLTPGQRAALKDMASWKDVIIRPFDKGTGFFLLDREDYI